MHDDLERFLIAQQTYYRTALQEIKNGQKRSHWMWFIFPQIAGLGHSETAWYYAIKNMDEARAYMEDYTLRSNLIEISEALLEVESNDAEKVMGWPDNLKLKSSMTLFSLVKPEYEVDELQVNANMTFDLIGNLGTLEYKEADSKELIAAYER